MKLVMLLLLAAASLCGQETPRQYYVFRSVTGTLNRITIRQPASGARALRFKGAWIKCPTVACTWTLSKNGTLSGGSAGTIVALDERGAAVTAAATYDGTVGSGTTVISEDLASGESRSLGESGLYLPAVGGKQITIEVTAGSSGALVVYLEFSEP